MFPILATLASSGLSLLSSAIQVKGKEVIESKLGIDLDKAVQTEEGLFKLKQLEIEHEEFLLNLSIKQIELELSDVKDARNLGVELSKSTYWLSGNIMPLMALITVLMSFIVLFVSPNTEDKMAAVSMATIVLGYFFGSSVGSKHKQELIDRVIK